MLLGSALRATIFLVCVTLVSLQVQGQERVPSGDLSDFFNPPGVKTEGLSSTTRKIDSAKRDAADKDAVMKGSDTKKSGMKDSMAPKVETPAPTPKTETEPKPPETEPKPPMQPRSKSPNNTGKVKIEVEELTEIEGGISFGPKSTTNWRVGFGMLTGAKAVQEVTCRIPVPVQWPEQTVSVFEENLPPTVTDVSWEDLGNIKLMKLRFGAVPPGTRVVATVTFTVSTNQIIGPKNTSIFRIPEKRNRETRPYFGESPGISVRNTKIKKEAKLRFANTLSDWKKVEGLFDWVRDNVEERSGDSKGSIAAFENKFGNTEDRVSLFVAMCRINKVPARMVWVDGSQYAEFYLVDNKKQGHWFPCKVSGIREFGSISEPRVILQKGDNYRVPKEKKKLKYVPAKAIVKGTSAPRKMAFSQEPLSVK